MPSVSSMIKDAIAAEGSDLKDTNYRLKKISDVLNQMPSVSSMIKDAIAAEGSDLKDTNYRTRHFSSDCNGPA